MDVRTSSRDFQAKTTEHAQFYRKWTVLWRSITLSSLDDHITFRPYCRYIRVLDFRNLSAMLEDYKFTGSIRTAFFAGKLRPFYFHNAEHRHQVLDVGATLNAIGEAVTAKTTLLEEIDGNVSPDFLSRWISRSPRLETMVLWKGEALANGAGQAISDTCENFRNLTLHEWTSPDADLSCSTFLNELKPDTLAYFEMISYNNISQLSFHALGRHRTLRQLELANLSDSAIVNLNALRDCTSLHTLKLEDNLGVLWLEEYYNNTFLEVVEWLSSCSELRDLSLKKFFDGPAFLSRVLQSPNVKLTRLSLEHYTVRKPSAQLFHSALADQKSLESVWLKGNGEDTIEDDLQIMVEGLCNLTNLRELVLKDVSDEFTEEHIMTLALSLPLLEEFWTSGDEVSAAVLPALGQLKHLKNLNLYAMTKFRASEIMEFLMSLDTEAQKGFSLSLMAADPLYDLTEENQEMIREYIRNNFDGRFDFVLWRDAELSDSDED